MKVVAVIMAGGKGERFWPKSRQSLPKQFLSITDDNKTMIQLTVERHLPLIKYEDTFVVTNSEYANLVREQLPMLPEENILSEPMARNTAPCIGYAAAIINRKYGDAVITVLASDHLIKNEMLYLDTLTQAVELALEDNNIVTLGITPSRPEIGYGYIKFTRDTTAQKRPGVYVVERFVEKPTLETAKEYMAAGSYIWNSGIFIWKASTILNSFELFLPDMCDGINQIINAYGTNSFEATLERCYANFTSVSVDYGIMEKASHIYTMPGNFGWDDVGSWLSLERINKTNEFGNIVKGDAITINTSDSIIYGNNKLIATAGIEEVIIIDTDDVLLVCAKTHTADVKKILENIKICNRNELL